MLTVLTLCLACHPPDLSQTLNWLRGSGRRGWVSRIEYRRCDDRRDYGCKGGFL